MIASVVHQGPPPDQIKGLFGAIAGGYDRANDLMTFGLARGWRRRLVQESGAKPGDHVLDCATGTGDLAIDFKNVVGASGHVIGSDFCAEMLAQAPAKARALGLEIEFKLADAMNLPFGDQLFDIASIAYGIRNVASPSRVLSEMARVCKPGGRVMILETGDSASPVLQSAIRFYFSHVVPRVGAMVTGKKWAYEYLSKSSSEFPSRERFLELMRDTGCFSSCEYISLLGGASFVYRGIVSVLPKIL